MFPSCESCSLFFPYFPTMFPSCSHIFPYFPNIYSHIFPSFSHHFPICSHHFPIIFPYVSWLGYTPITSPTLPRDPRCRSSAPPNEHSRSPFHQAWICQWSGLRENLNRKLRKPSIFLWIMGLSCKFSLKPIH